MKTPFAHCLSCLAALAMFAGAFAPVPAAGAASDAGTAAVIARARAFLGGDAALNAVKSLHYVGTVTNPEGKTHKIEIFVRHPMQQRVLESTDEAISLTVLNDYTGWRRGAAIVHFDRSPIGLLPAAEVRRLRANTWQNIHFYAGMEQVGGTVTLDGDAEKDGVLCDKVTFAHTGGFRFIRYFEKSTGRLVVTETEDGTEARESGEVRVAGVRFPRELRSTSGGKTSVVVFEEVRVNEEIDDAMFELPAMRFELPSLPKAPPADTAPAEPGSATP